MIGGFNLVDLMNLPTFERTIMRLALRKVTMTYPQLREVAIERHMNQEKLDEALDHLLKIHWLIRQVNNQQVVYRVNVIGKRGAVRQDSENNLDRSQQGAEADFLTMQRGGKRLLPAQIWESLADSGETNAPEPPTKRTPRRTSLLDRLIDDSTRDDQ